MYLDILGGLWNLQVLDMVTMMFPTTGCYNLDMVEPVFKVSLNAEAGTFGLPRYPHNKHMMKLCYFKGQIPNTRENH